MFLDCTWTKNWTSSVSTLVDRTSGHSFFSYTYEYSFGICKRQYWVLRNPQLKIHHNTVVNNYLHPYVITFKSTQKLPVGESRMSRGVGVVYKGWTYYFNIPTLICKTDKPSYPNPGNLLSSDHLLVSYQILRPQVRTSIHLRSNWSYYYLF